MKQQTKLGKSLFTVAFMLGVTVVFISVLSLIHVATAETVRLNEGLYLKRAVLSAAGIQVPEAGAEVDRVFADRVKAVEDSSGTVLHYRILDRGGNLQSYVFPITGSGLWGEIDSVVGVSQDLQALTGIDFTQQNETPGLGGRISEQWFREQFRGKEPPLKTVPEGQSAGPQQFQAITGASITTGAVQDIVNRRLAGAEQRLKQGK